MEFNYLKEGLHVLAELGLGNTPEITPAKVGAYHMALADVLEPFFTLALARISRRGTVSGFFPSAPELRKICLEASNPVDDPMLHYSIFRKLCATCSKEAALKKAASNIKLVECIKALYDGFSKSSPEKESYWVDAFKKTYSAFYKTETNKQLESFSFLENQAVTESGLVKIDLS